MKKSLLVAMFLSSAWAGLASGSTVVSYTATASPGSNPDGVDQSNTAVDVWQETLSPTGGNGSDYGTVDSIPNAWGIYSYPSSGVSGSDDENHTFDGGALAVGQTVSILFANNIDIDPGGAVGLSLTGGSVPLSFYFAGGVNDYRYDDAGGTSQDTGLGYTNNTPITVVYTLTGASTYTASATYGTTSVAWNGTYSGSITGIDVFNHQAGNISDVGFNDLAVTGTATPSPEPASLGLIGVLGAATLGRRRK